MSSAAMPTPDRPDPAVPDLQLTALAAAGDPERSLVLVIDDDPVMRRLLELRLTAPDRVVVTAETVGEAEQVLANAVVSLVVLDLFLPDADGRTLLAELRNRPGTAQLPIVVVSGSASALVKAECFGLGADGYLEKPVDLDAAAGLVASLLRRRPEPPPPSREPAVGEAPDRAERVFADALQAQPGLVAVAVIEPEYHGLGPQAGREQQLRLLGAAREVMEATIGDDGAVASDADGQLVVVVPGATSAAAARLIDRARLRLRNRPTGPGSTGMISMSAGVVDGAARPDFSYARSAARDLAERARTTGGDRVVTESLRRAGGAKVLLAEDDALTAALIIHRLRREGLEVLHVRDGEAALAAARAEQLALAILDVNMPRLDGFEVLGRLRAMAEFAQVPIVMLTAMGGERDVVRGFELGADDYILKPFSPSELTVRIQRLLPRG